MSTGTRRKFGPNKYVALSLMVAKWLRLYSSNSEELTYITLGGTELLDVLFLSWIDKRMFSEVVSFETKSERYNLAMTMGGRLQEKGLNVTVCEGSVFDYQRNQDRKHIFFIDLEGVCKPEPYTEYFRSWFESDTIRPGDLLLVTSYLGRHPGWKKVLSPFDSVFRILRIESAREKQRVYRLAHPLFILYQAIRRARLEQDVRLTCIGYAKYKDTSPITTLSV
jgi:hypothetical protein